MIDRYRQEIDDIDDQIIELLNQRFKLTNAIGKVKASIGQPIRHTTREKAIVNRLAKHQSAHFKQLIIKIYIIIFKMSRRQQKSVAKESN